MAEWTSSISEEGSSTGGEAHLHNPEFRAIYGTGPNAAGKIHSPPTVLVFCFGLTFPYATLSRLAYGQGTHLNADLRK